MGMEDEVVVEVVELDDGREPGFFGTVEESGFESVEARRTL